MAKTSRLRVPVHLRIPRPTSSGPAPRRLAWLGLEAAAVAAGALIAAVAPLGGLDAAARGLTLEALASRDPSARLMLVVASPEDLRDGACARALDDLLELGGARGALLVPPADVFCERPGGAGPGDARPVVRLPPEVLRIRGGQVAGFGPPDQAPGGSALRALGVADAPWVLPKAERSVPAITLAELIEGRLPPSVLHGRVVLVAAGAGVRGTSDPAGAAGAALGPAESAAAALGGLLEDGRRVESPRWAAPLLVLLAGLLVRASARRGLITAALTTAALAAMLVAGQALAVARAGAALLPVASALLGLGVAAGGVALSRALRRRRAMHTAAELVERAALFRMQGVHTLADEDFWPRVARLASQAHPAELCLVAELPPRSWHLRFWNDRQGGESLVSERRRDVRRVPFSNEQGVPTTHVVRRFLSKQDMPAVAVPLTALGELEGYVFLCGAVAEETFTREPERAARLGRELALLIRRKRLGRVAEPGAPADAGARPEPAEGLVEGARVALGDLELFGAVLRSAPVGLLYADAFGDVRFLSRELAAWLREHDVTVPPEGPGAALPPGSLRLGDVIEAAEESASREGAGEGRPPTWLSSVMASEEGIEIPVVGRGVFHVRPLRQEADGHSWIAGYVAALVPAEQAATRQVNVRPLGARESVDPLNAFPLGEIVGEAVAAAARATGRTLRLEPIRGAAHAVGHRAELAQALTALLVDVATRGLPGHGPVVSVREVAHGVQLSILDVGFGLGLPESALQRVLMAPSAAPPGLEPLGRLIVAVEDSHGEAELKTNDGWGITLVITLLRAHPRLGPVSPESSRTATPNVIAIGRAAPK
jgi:hypothetical protein